ncbi:hypothetical protein KC19_VG127000 [Ceratodon purpureus]|uniref:Secreted protein n=1 Tax=Ceratodon purpureus TaxID=3225 RepID=A0A8T0HQH5_CERPU|nr:hypothetical protein KC19_VG127000 [Ceratodon purpureus]
MLFLTLFLVLCTVFLFSEPFELFCFMKCWQYHKDSNRARLFAFACPSSRLVYDGW